MFKKTISVLLTALMVAGLIPAGVMQAFAVGDPDPITASFTLSVGENSVDITEDEPQPYCAFTPTESAPFVFYSTGNEDTYASLYSADGSYIVDNDDGGEGNNFLIKSNLTAGETYYLRVRYYNTDVTGSIPVTVMQKQAANALSITRNGEAVESLTVYEKSQLQLGSKLLPENCEEEDVKWSSSDDSVATVQQYDGYVEFLKPGKATVTATSENGLTASCNITVNEALPIAEGTAQHFAVTTPGERIVYRLTAAESRLYTFSSNGSSDAWGKLVRSDCVQINEASGYRFSFNSRLAAGETYYFDVGVCDGVGESDVRYDAVPYAQSMTLDHTTLTGFPDYYTDLSATFHPDGTWKENITWKSSNDDVVQVDSYGWVTMISPGTATITATSERGLTASCAVTVKDYIPLTVGTAATAEIPDEDNYVIFRFTAPEAGTYLFTSSGNDGKPTYAALCNGDMDQLDFKRSNYTDNNYKLRAELAKDEICYLRTGFDNDDVGSFAVTATKAGVANALAVQPDTAAGYPGSTLNLTALFLPEDSITEDVTWSSSDENVATVDEDGCVQLIAFGTATVTAVSTSGLTASAAVTVKDYDPIAVGETKNDVIAQGGDRLYYRFTPEESGDYIFYSSAEGDTYGILYDADMNELVSDDDSGSERNFRITYGLEAGTPYILCAYYYYNSVTGALPVTLKRDIPATAITITQGDTLSGKPGDSFELSVTAQPDGADAGEVIWSSSDNDVATVTEYGGRVTLESFGTAVITAEAGALQAKCTVTVSFGDCELLTVGESKPVTILSPDDDVVFKLTPSEDISAVFWSSGDLDTFVRLYDAEMNELTTDDDSGADQNFRLAADLQGGKTYYLQARCYGNATGSFMLSSTTVAAAESLFILQGDSMTGYVGRGRWLEVGTVPDGASTGVLTWTSSKDSIVSVDDSGYIELKAVGTATVTVKNNKGLSDSIVVTVRDYRTLTVGEEQTAVIASPGDEVVYRFIPEADGCYAFWSTGDEDSYARLYDGDFTERKYNDDSGEDENFRLSGMLEAGETYYLAVSMRNENGTGSFTVHAAETEYVTGLQILRYPDRMTYVEGYVGPYINFTGLQIRTTWSDGETIDWTYGGSRTIRGEYVDLFTIGNTVTVACGEESAQFDLTVIENPVASVTVLNGTAATLCEFAAGSWQQQDDGTRWFRYEYDTLSDVAVQINYTDGTTRTAHVGETVDGYRITTNDRQIVQHWQVGANPVTVNYLGAYDETYVTVTENPVEGIAVISEPESNLIENVNCRTERRFNNETGSYEPFTYYYVDNLYDVKVQINYKDGSTKTARIGDKVDGYRISTGTDQYTTPFTVGSHNAVTVSYMGRETQMFVTLEENPVLSLEAVSPSQNVLYENADGETRTRYDEATGMQVPYFWYDLSVLNDAQVRINFKDGTSRTANVGSYLNGYWVGTESEQGNAPFTRGGANTYYVTYLGARLEMHATVAENPVEFIEVPQDAPVTLIEGVDGYTSSVYNPVTDAYDIDVFIYSISDAERVPVRIHYKDGSVIDAHINERVNGRNISVSHNQSENPWTVGGDNRFTVSYMGKTAEATATVVPNPVDRLEVVQSTAATLIENGDGYFTDSYNPETGDYDLEYFYYTMPDMEDAVIRIVYTDGTSRTAHINEIVDGYRVYARSDQSFEHPWQRGENPVTVNYMNRSVTMSVRVIETPVAGIVINQAPTRQYVFGDNVYFHGEDFDPFDLTGIRFTVNFKNGTSKTYTDRDIRDGECDGHVYWVTAEGKPVVGNNTVTFSYMNVTATYTVKVVDNPYEKLEVVKLPDKPVYSQYYSPDWRGMKVKITRKNGTSKTVTLTDDNMVYGFDGNMGFYVGFEADGVTGMIISRYEGDTQRSFLVRYAGLEATVGEMTYRVDPLVTAVEVEDFSRTGENMLLKVTYENGTKENIRLTDVKDCSKGWIAEAAYGRALTDKGLLSFYIYNEEMDYDLSVFDIRVKLDTPAPEDVIGDVTGDGVVTIDDATRLLAYLAEFAVPNVDRILRLGDMNVDGRIDVNDVTAIQRYLAGF